MGNSGQRSEQSRTVRIDKQHSQHGATTAIVVKTLLLTGRFGFNELGLAGGRRPPDQSAVVRGRVKHLCGPCSPRELVRVRTTRGPPAPNQVIVAAVPGHTHDLRERSNI